MQYTSHYWARAKQRFFQTQQQQQPSFRQFNRRKRTVLKTKYPELRNLLIKIRNDFFNATQLDRKYDMTKFHQDWDIVLSPEETANNVKLEMYWGRDSKSILVATVDAQRLTFEQGSRRAGIMIGSNRTLLNRIANKLWPMMHRKWQVVQIRSKGPALLIKAKNREEIAEDILIVD